MLLLVSWGLWGTLDDNWLSRERLSHIIPTFGFAVFFMCQSTNTWEEVVLDHTIPWSLNKECHLLKKKTALSFTVQTQH